MNPKRKLRWQHKMVWALNLKAFLLNSLTQILLRQNLCAESSRYHFYYYCYCMHFHHVLVTQNFKSKKKKRTQKKTKKGVLFSLFLFPKQGENQGKGEDREKKQVATYFAFSHTLSVDSNTHGSYFLYSFLHTLSLSLWTHKQREHSQRQNRTNL